MILFSMRLHSPKIINFIIYNDCYYDKLPLFVINCFNVPPLQYSVTRKQNLSSWTMQSLFNTYGLDRVINAVFSIFKRYNETSLLIVANSIALTAIC
jgi:hypothetical protein